MISHMESDSTPKKENLCSVEFIDEDKPNMRPSGPSYLVTLDQAKNVPAVSWEKEGLFLTLNGYWYFFNRARDLKISVSDFLRDAGFVSIISKNKQIEDPYERFTMWVSPENKLITRREYSRHQYLAKKKSISVKEHLLELGYFRLKDTESKNKSGE